MFCKISFYFLIASFSIFADLHKMVGEYFEWGEYSTLIDSLAPCIDSLSEVTDSSEIARYHSYLGVAYFSIEKISDARSHFLKALLFDSSISLPAEYVSNEISTLFRVIKSEFEKQKRLKFIEDSLVSVHNHEIEITNKNVLATEIGKKRQHFIIASVSSSVVGAVFLGLGIFQHVAAQPMYSEFKDAAELGDQFRYNKLHNELNRSNYLILTFEITSGITFCGGIVTAIKAHHIKKELSGLK